MSRAHRVWFPRTRAVLARGLRPVCARWPFAWGRRTLVRRLVPDVAQLPVGAVAAMRPGFCLHVRADPVYRAIWLFGDFDPAETRFFRRFLRPGDAVVDVGANFGWHTLGFARAVGPTGRVLAFEPVPPTRAHLEANLALNGVADRVTVRPEALGAAAGATTIYTFGRASLAEASGHDQGRDDAVPHAVAIDTLDAVAQRVGFPRPVLCKVDVEGFELDVFRGAGGWLAGDDAPVLAFEMNRTCLAHVGVTPAQCFGWLRDAGYRAFWRVEPDGRTVAASDLEWTGRGAHRNYVAAKAAAVERVRRAL